ncbi:MAG: phosphoenolpyruvate carboxylase [Lysobacteraceae bacterium]
MSHSTDVADPAAASLREIEFPAVDQPLREDVNRLGGLVGEMLAEQAGADFLARVEALRRAAILRRESGAPLADLASALADLPLDRAEALVRAFAAWFGAVNIAERVHRIRRRRDYQKQGAAVQPGSFGAVLQDLRAAGVDDAELAAFLPGLSIQPVFTAHPTEAVRRVLLEKERNIVRSLVDDIDRTRTPQERERDISRIRMALTASWQTAEHAQEKPSVGDELEHVAFYLADVLYRVLPAYMEALRAALGPAAAALPPAPLRFGSWVGGDMDGNPNVGAATIRATLDAQRRLVLEAYRRDLRQLAAVLTQSLERVAVDRAVLERIDAYVALLPQAAATLKSRHANMPYRQLLTLMGARLLALLRLARGRGDPAQAYADAGEFRDDLALIHASLLAHQGAHAGAFAVRRTLDRVEAFGFHLAALDLRQDSRMHEAALAALLDEPDWAERPLAWRIECLSALWRGVRQPGRPQAEAARAVLDVFRARAELRRRDGEHAFGPYIVSMSRHVADALAVLALARIAGDCEADGATPIDVAPLFETVDDLYRAPEVMAALLADPDYRRHLAARGDRQIVMLGYSDSAKDAGMLASRWAVQRCQVSLSTLAREAGVQLVFFHGRGGSASRGGGKTERAVIASPRGSVNGVLRLTEQGEVIHRKYGIRALALRNLEQATGAVLRASLRPRPPEPREERWRALATALAQRSREVYRALVHEDRDFVAYFRLATPIDVIERLKLGSRPAKRAAGGQAGVESLRAIPWVFAWSQNRSMLTAWYGVGAALDEAVQREGRDALAEVARDWPFFATLIDDVEMVLAKADLGIFEAYSELAGDLHRPFFARIAGEFQRARDAVLAIRGSDELLSDDRRLALSIRLRNPYVDPISLLQVDLLRRWRAAERPDDALFHALASTVNGIAAGVQNTG